MSEIMLSPHTSITRQFAPAIESVVTSFPNTERRLQRSTKRGDWTCVRYSWRWFGASLGTLLAGSAAFGQLLTSGNWSLTVAAGGALGLAGAYAALVEPSSPVLEQIELRLPRLPKALHGLRVMQISDMHLGSRYSRHNLRQAVAMVKRERPDLVVLTGDFVHEPEPIAELPELLDGIGAPLGCYAVLGNHDYWEGPQEVVDMLARVGVETLINENRLLRWHGGSFWLLGVDEPWSGTPDLDLALQGVPANAFTLLLAHTPETADEAAARGIDLQLSGHTHGGHMNLPVLGAFALPKHGWRYAIGLERINDTVVYTNRGLGGMPVRLNCAPEVTLLTLLSESH